MRFEIATHAGRVSFPCYATRCEGIVAHRRSSATGEPLKAGWILSHAASGYSLGRSFDRRAEALAFASRLAEACEESGFRWDVIGTDGQMTSAIGKAAAAVCKRAIAHGDLAHTALEMHLRPIETDPMRRQINRGLDGMRETNYLAR